MPQTTGDDIESRLLDFAVRIIRVCDALPRKPAAKHIRDQLLRSGTAPAPNYAEARAAESRRDFVHKLRVAMKELNETRVWLTMIVRAGFVPTERLRPVSDECEQLCRVIGKSIQTASTKIRR